jgi:transposase
MKISRVALDLAKNVIQVHAVDRSGAAVVRKALKRAQLLPFMRDLPPCEVGMEACASAHHWGRQLQAMGHTVHLLPAQYVKPFVIGQKNDANDAAAICAAMGHSGIPRVTVKTIAQQDMQALHRSRSMKMKQRTAIINQTRGLLAEYGIVIAKNPATLRKAIPELLEDADNGLSFDFRQLLSELYGDLQVIDNRVAELTQRIERTVRTSDDVKRLLAMPDSPGMAAFLGLVPRQHASGGKQTLLGIHKRGDCYLRGLLVHGARSVLRTATDKPDDRSRWLMNLAEKRHRNIATVAQANKTVRIAWAILTREQRYRAAWNTPSTSLPTDDEDHWEDQRGKSLSSLAAFKADDPMRHPRATAPSWPEAKGFTHRPDIRSQSQLRSKKRLAIGRSPYTPYADGARRSISTPITPAAPSPRRADCRPGPAAG